MDKINLISKIAELYGEGKNIIAYLKDLDGRNENTIEDILISYDFQAGSYIRFARENPIYIDNYAGAISKILSGLLTRGSIVEVGVGEATTLGNVSLKLGQGFVYGGFDISWSRIFHANDYLSGLNVNATLFTSDLFKMPFQDDSIDIIYSSHSLEPNGGREEEALKELYRVASKYLVLLEPGYEFATEEGKTRMKKNGYIKNLRNVIHTLNYNLIEYRQFDFSSNSLNPTALYIIEKSNSQNSNTEINLVCPITHSPLIERPDHLFSPMALVSYPKVMGIPCLVVNNAILTTKMP